MQGSYVSFVPNQHDEHEALWPHIHHAGLVQKKHNSIARTHMIMRLSLWVSAMELCLFGVEPLKGIPSNWLPPFIEDALNKVIGYTTRMTQRKSKHMSIEKLSCEPSLKLICLKFSMQIKSYKELCCIKLVMPMGLEYIYFPYLWDIDKTYD